MKVLGFVTEYNPFHYGHLYHLSKSKEISNCDFSIAVMSGSFVQRGEPSFIDKWTKAKIAIDNGIDLVLELPAIYSVQSAELFAYGGIKLLDSLKIVDYISFGSEIGNLEPLKVIAQVLLEEPKTYRTKLKKYLQDGNSFSVSRSLAMEEYLKLEKKVDYNTRKIMTSPNNILAIEYLKALYRLNSDIIPITIKRTGSEYKDKNFTHKFASATAIREKAMANKLSDIKNYIPFKTYYHINKYIEQYKSFNNIKNYSQILLYLLRSSDEKTLSKIMDVETGLENRLVQYSFKYNTIDKIINSVVSKRHTKTRIQRILIHLMLHLDKTTFLRLNNVYPKYIRILGMNEKGMKLLREIKRNTEIPIINRFNDFNKYNDPLLNEMIYYDKLATDLFFLGLNLDEMRLGNKDFITSPYIKHLKE